ncbi:hypothetical protein D918_07709 [Trichuris suis]|nr:hypothetical protein D918_07709 [Trichuris suis]
MSFVRFPFILVLFICVLESAQRKYLCPRSEQAFRRAEARYAGVEETCDAVCKTEKAEWKRYNQTEPAYIELYDDYKECYSQCEVEQMTNYTRYLILSSKVKAEKSEKTPKQKRIAWRRDPEILKLQRELQEECIQQCKPASDFMNRKRNETFVRDVYFSCLYVCYSEQASWLQWFGTVKVGPSCE